MIHCVLIKKALNKITGCVDTQQEWVIIFTMDKNIEQKSCKKISVLGIMLAYGR